MMPMPRLKYEFLCSIYVMCGQTIFKYAKHHTEGRMLGIYNANKGLDDFINKTFFHRKTKNIPPVSKNTTTILQQV